MPMHERELNEWEKESDKEEFYKFERLHTYFQSYNNYCGQHNCYSMSISIFLITITIIITVKSLKSKF